MTKRNHIAWTPYEEKDLIFRVKRHPELSWEARAERYSLEPGHHELTAESMHSKHRQLCRGIHRYRRIHNGFPAQQVPIQQVRCQKWRHVGHNTDQAIPPPPTPTLQARGSRMQAVAQQIQQRR